MFSAVVTLMAGACTARTLKTLSGKLVKGDFGAAKSSYYFYFFLLGDAFPSDSTEALHVVNMVLENLS